MEYVKLHQLREGAIFETMDGIKAVKSEYYYSTAFDAQSMCILLTSGEYAHFPDGNATLVQEITL